MKKTIKINESDLRRMIAESVKGAIMEMNEGGGYDMSTPEGRRNTECNARCSEFGSFLMKEKHIKSLEEYEDITRLKRIKSFLDEGERIPVNNIKNFQRRFDNYRRRIFKIYSGVQAH